MAICRECRETIPYSSKICPHCGDPHPFGDTESRALFNWLVGGGGIFLLWVIYRMLLRYLH